jgi:hypothetical protein
MTILNLKDCKLRSVHMKEDITYLKNIYANARKKYEPTSIRVLIVAEAPPCALDRFFYFEDVKKQDSLFLEIMGILYPKLKKQYLASGRNTLLKQELLEEFRSDGYWLMDLSEVPTSIVGDITDKDVEGLLEKIKMKIDRETPIILIKSNVYDTCYKILTSNGYKVIDERLPFPGSGQQKVFREKFQRALHSCE